MINWVLQLNNSQSVNSFNSLLEKHHVLIFPNQPNQSPIQSVIDRGNLRTQNVFLWIKEKRPLNSHEEKFLDKQNSSNQSNQSQNQSVIDQGNLITNTKCLLIKAKHPGLERSRRSLLTKNSFLQIDQGNLINMKSHYEQPLKYIVRLRRSTPTMS